MASPARTFVAPTPVLIASKPPQTISSARWAFITGQPSALIRSEGTLYICNAEALRCLTGVAWALAIEAVAAVSLYGLWRLGRLLF